MTNRGVKYQPRINTIQHLEANVEYLKCIAQQAAPATVQAVGCVKDCEGPPYEYPNTYHQKHVTDRYWLRRMSGV